MLERYAEAATPDLAMGLDEVLGYLSKMEDNHLSPLQSILAQTESMADPALPTSDQMAILQWLGSAFDNWEQQFLLEESLRLELRRLKPLAASLALTDPDFLQPGRHPIHRMLDALQLSAVGWQAGLGRAGQATQKQIKDAVESALTWFNNAELDLESACTQIIEACERDQARANRMTRRLVEADQGRARTAEAKRTAAESINAAMTEFQAPAIIGNFLKGPWYDSAQLVLLKFGIESAQWTQMCKTTHTLLDSVQFTEDDADLEADGNPQTRQRLFELVSQLPKEIKRWLISLQHDGDAVESAMEMVEIAYMQILRKQPLELQQLELIPVAAAKKGGYPEQVALAPGQWFSIDLEGDAPTRLRLVSPLEDTGELLFSNLAGIKVLQVGFEEFAGLMKQGKANTLDSGSSFSRSLTLAAGIRSTDDFDKVFGPELLSVKRDEEPQDQPPKRELPEKVTSKQEAAPGQLNDNKDALQREWHDDQRKHLRLPVEGTVFIGLVSPGIGKVDSGKVAICKTLDISRGGLQVSLEHELVVGAILQIGVELPESQETLYLAGEVRWCLQNGEEENRWSAGFALLNAVDSDIDAWIALLSGMER